MARERYQTLTEQMFYVLICLEEECCGVDIMKKIASITKERVRIGPGTLYSLLDNFLIEKFIVETTMIQRKKSYIITDLGKEIVKKEILRLNSQIDDYQIHVVNKRKGGN